MKNNVIQKCDKFWISSSIKPNSYFWGLQVIIEGKSVSTFSLKYSIQTSFLLDITHSFSLRKSNSKSICPLLDSLLTCQTIFCSQNSGGCMCSCGGTMYVVVKLQLVIVVQNIWWNILYLYTIYINSKNIFPYEFGKWYSYTSILLWKLICSLFFH